MKRQMFFATAFSAALAVGVAAQTGTGTGAQTGAQETQKAQQVTMTGCLQKATPGTAGTSGTAEPGATASKSDQFILANATPASASTSGTAGTTGTPPSGAPSSSMGNKYRLIGGDDEDLQKYMNSKVEIRGTIDRSSSTGATGARPGQSDTDKLPALRVTSVRQLEKTCPAGN